MAAPCSDVERRPDQSWTDQARGRGGCGRIQMRCWLPEVGLEATSPHQCRPNQADGGL
jgi:hypothetical protein